MTKLQDLMDQHFDPSDSNAAQSVASSGLRLLKELAKRSNPAMSMDDAVQVCKAVRSLANQLGLLVDNEEMTDAELLQFLAEDQ